MYFLLLHSLTSSRPCARTPGCYQCGGTRGLWPRPRLLAVGHVKGGRLGKGGGCLESHWTWRGKGDRGGDHHSYNLGWAGDTHERGYRGEREEEGRKRMNDQGREERRRLKGWNCFLVVAITFLKLYKPLPQNCLEWTPPLQRFHKGKAN